jgi:ATP-dependent protease Clp ATPase subunit
MLSSSFIVVVATVIAAILGALFIFLRRPSIRDNTAPDADGVPVITKQKRDVVAVIGPVGSGKTVLLHQVGHSFTWHA